MQRIKLLTLLFILSSQFSFAQEEDTLTTQLADVTVRSFEQTRKYKDVPASVAYLNENVIRQFHLQSIVPAMNTIPGVRMEERSPGSYRLNIRGSSLRSPFGVRNVKIYYNDLPFTDPGGQSYLNQLGTYNFASAEILKGPSGSIYGAGTGGVLLIDPLHNVQNENAFAEYGFGSFNTHNLYGRFTTGSLNKTQISFQHQQSDGYRDHSALRRNVFAWNGIYNFSKAVLKTTFLYGDLKYETPGGLTENEFNADPRSSRPAAGVFPSAAQANASVMQKMFIAGASLNAYIGKGFANKTSLYGMFSELKNPAIQNYQHNNEPHAGIRSVFTYKPAMQNGEIAVQFGTELQQGFAKVNVYKNVNGNKDSLRTSDDINTRNFLNFAQFNFENESWILTAAGSFNHLQIDYERFSPAGSGAKTIRFNNFSPRAAVLKKFKAVNMYASVAKGFSPPTTNEFFPGGNAMNTTLEPEKGWNYELGMKGNIIAELFFNINAYHFNLSNAIALRRTAGGGDYYINAGKTKQQGVEALLQFNKQNASGFIQRSASFVSYTYSNFKYLDFEQTTNDYSGKRLPSVPVHAIAAGTDLRFSERFSAAFNYNFNSRVALNDANTVYAEAYHLVNAKLNYFLIRNQRLRSVLSFGMDNLLNERYSLGNDINAFNGRYLNAAPGRNFYLTLNFQFLK